MGAKRSIQLQSAYRASKHGIDGFLESLRVELEREGLPISVTNVMPATINTPFFDKARTKLGVRSVAPPPIYQPSIVAAAILYAAQHPARDLVVGGAAEAVILSQAILIVGRARRPISSHALRRSAWSRRFLSGVTFCRASIRKLAGMSNAGLDPQRPNWLSWRYLQRRCPTGRRR